MTRYYYNENPQVTLWREVAEEYQKVARDCIETTKSYARLVKDSQRQFNEMAKVSEEAINTSDKAAQVLEDYKSTMRKFDSLPWYKKMFYKFKI